jgi:hypothetical protein
MLWLLLPLLLPLLLLLLLVLPDSACQKFVLSLGQMHSGSHYWIQSDVS